MANLYLIPTSLNPQAQNNALIPRQLQQIKHITNFIVETAKIGRAHLKLLELATPLQQLVIFELNKHKQDYSALIAPLQHGHDVGLISDCGCPAVADPGGRVVSLAHELGFNVIPLIGPSSILLSLMASGLNGQKFTFAGYLPSNPEARRKELRILEKDILHNKTTYIFIEAPFRNQAVLNSILNEINPDLRLCIACNLMTDEQSIVTKSVSQWKNALANLQKQETIFLLGA